MRKQILAVTAVLALAAAPAFAQSQKSTHAKAPKPSAAGATADQTFVKKAAAGGLAEVELGTLAKDKASSEQVKEFARRMVDDHGKTNDELKTLAQNKSITLPSTLDPTDQALKDRLSKLSGEQFDRAYMQAMLKDHTKDVNEFRRESKSAKDPDVKAFAAKTLPTLEDHLKLAQQDSKAVATSGTKKTSRKTGK